MRRIPMVPSVAFAMALCVALPATPDEPPPDQDPAEAAIEQRWLDAIEEQGGPSHASGHRPEQGPVVRGNPTQVVVTMRVGLHYSYTSTGAFSEFATRDHPQVQVSNLEGEARVVDRATGRRVGTLDPGENYTVFFNGTLYMVAGSDGTNVAVAGPVLISPGTAADRLRVESIERTNVVAGGRVRPQYRGSLEIARSTATLPERVNLVNVIELESYVRGVVVNESPAFFHAEALKAQAVAARGYAAANIGNWVARGYPFDIVDSASSQVYRGVVAEHPNGVAATEQTRGLTASFEADIISALYSSSFGGYSESNEWIFNLPPTQLPGSNAAPYLRSIYDGLPPEFDMNDPAQRDPFWSVNQSQTYDDCVDVRNRFARWRLTIPASAIKARLPGRVVPADADLSGAITGVSVTQRMPLSARIARVEVTLTTAIVEVRGWDNLRRVFGASAAPTPDCRTGTIANNFVLNNPTLLEPTTDGAGTFTGVVSTGGGWGHNVGLSQFGAHGRGLSGQSFLEILNAYYASVDIGTYPIDIGPGTPSVRKLSFVSPNGDGVLEIRPQGMRKLNVVFNDTNIVKFDADDLSSPIVRVDVSQYLLAGVNTVQYIPQEGTATAVVIVD